MADVKKNKRFDKSFQAVELQLDTFNEHLNSHGILMLHIPVSHCPNYDSLERGNHDINCPLCDNNFLELEATEFIGIITSKGVERNYSLTGAWETGTGFLTATSDIRLMHQDIIEIPDSESIYGELREKSATKIDKSRYLIKKVLFLRTANREYCEDTDFKVNNDGRIEWISKNRPTEGEVYTIRYTYATRYRVISILNETRDALIKGKSEDKDHKRFPMRALVKLDYLVDNDNDQDDND